MEEQYIMSAYIQKKLKLMKMYSPLLIRAQIKCKALLAPLIQSYLLFIFIFNNSLYAAEKTDNTTYESLTENRGIFQLMQEKRQELEKQKKDLENKKNPSNEDSALPPSKTNSPASTNSEEGALINFNNVSITEVLKYVSRLTGKNFIYDPDELQFSISMISDSEASLQDIMSMLLQNLEVHGFSLIEQGNSYVIHANADVKGINSVYKKNGGIQGPQIATQVFLLQNVEAERCAAIVRAMISKDAVVEVIESSKIIVSDIAENIRKLSEIIKQLDTQSSGLEIGQYVTINLSPTMVSSLAERIMTPLANNKPFILVPHSASNSVFIVSTPYLIERTLAVMQTVDLNQAQSGVLWGDKNRFDPKLAQDAQKRLSEGSDILPIPPEMSEQDILSLPRQEVNQMLLARGFTQAQIDALNDREARALLWQELNSVEEAKKRALKRRRMYSDSDLPLGSVEATQFFIYKLQYRKSTDVANALKAIATSLMSVNSANQITSTPQADLAQSDLVITLNSLQPVEDNNSLVFTGTRASLDKLKELLLQIDVPVRQVFIEALVLDTTLANSLEFGVEWGGKIVRKNFGTQIGFVRPADSTFGRAFGDIQQTTPTQIQSPTTGGLSAGAIGRKIKFRGQGFRSTGALINALHVDDEAHVMMNPKITTEHNIPAEIFVGAQVPIKGQSIANATTGSSSSIVATNYETQEVGILLKVTPLISSHETVTLIIDQKVSSTSSVEVQAQGGNNAPPATVKESHTTTRVHLPSDHFLIISGMIHEEKDYKNSKIPCLGGLPYIGSLFGSKKTSYSKRNLMIFIRPIILDTPQDIDEITRNQEKLLKAKSRVNQGWNKEKDDIIELLNL